MARAQRRRLLHRLQSPFRAAFRAHARPHRLAANSATIYSCRMFYGNGTARLVRDSAWRDQGAGVLPDLGSHLLDTCRFWFGDIGDGFQFVSRAQLREPRAGSCRHRIARKRRPRIELEMTLLMWRNHFTCDILAESGSAHIQSLCKWGPSAFTQRTPRPAERAARRRRAGTLVQDDPTWALEYAHFKSSVQLGREDRSVERSLAASRAAASGRRGHSHREVRDEEPVVGFAGMTHLGLVSAGVRRRHAALTSCASMPTRAVIRRLAQAGLAGARAGARRSDRASNAATTDVSPTRSAISGRAMSSMSRPTCRPTTKAAATSRD